MSRAQDLFDRLVNGGKTEVQSFIAQSVTEELFLDYKRSADNGAGNALHNRDRSNLAKAISGFGDSEGGVIVWGVDCRSDPSFGDIPTAPVHIQNPTRFKSWLEQATSGLTVPPHDSVRHHAISEGFVVTLIPSGTHAPYQTVGDLSYYMRAGSNFAKVPHAVLSGLFGRRPQPAIKHRFFIPDAPRIVGPGRIRTQVGIMLRNFGRGIAEDIFLNLAIKSHPGKDCEVNFQPSEESDVWNGRLLLSQQMQLMTRPGFRLPPEADLMPLTLEIVLQPPIEYDLAFAGLCGSSGGEPARFYFKSSVIDMEAAVEQYYELSQKFAGTPISAATAKTAAGNFNKTLFKSVPNA